MRGRGRRAVWDGTIEVQGAEIDAAEPVSFDSPADGIDERGHGVSEKKKERTLPSAHGERSDQNWNSSLRRPMMSLQSALTLSR